ncbi:hypothetical protein F5880DRAFT_1615404 [Lentinula raphanica]|nr:hypothetical protein F5880DRAFT_1615404 [Lentinula raphanica]
MPDGLMMLSSRAVCDSVLNTEVLDIAICAPDERDPDVPSRVAFLRYIASLHSSDAENMLSRYLVGIVNDYGDAYAEWYKTLQCTVEQLLCPTTEMTRLDPSPADSKEDVAGSATQAGSTFVRNPDVGNTGAPADPKRHKSGPEIEDDLGEHGWDDAWYRVSLKQANTSNTDEEVEVSSQLKSESQLFILQQENDSSFACRGPNHDENEDDSDAEDSVTVRTMLSIIEDDVQSDDTKSTVATSSLTSDLPVSDSNFFMGGPTNTGELRLFSNPSTVGLYPDSPDQEYSEDRTLNSPLNAASEDPSRKASDKTTVSPGAQTRIDADKLMDMLRTSKDKLIKAIDDHFEVVAEVLQKAKNGSEDSVPLPARKISVPANMPSQAVPSSLPSANASYIFCL